MDITNSFQGSAAYRQVARQLAYRIETGDLKPGAQLLSERALAESLGVSRITTRQATGLLREAGLVIRQQGRGTFVREPSNVAVGSWSAQELHGFFTQLRQQGFVPSADVLGAEVASASVDVAAALHLEIGAPVARVTRVLRGSGIPMGLDLSYWSLVLFPDFLSHDLSGSLFDLLRDKYDAVPWRAESMLQAIAADAQQAEALGVPLGSPLMRVERRSWDVRGRAVEFAIDVYKPMAGRFQITSQVTAGTGVSSTDDTRVDTG